MQKIEFDPAARRITVGPGVMMGMINQVTTAVGQLFPVGVYYGVGIGLLLQVRGTAEIHRATGPRPSPLPRRSQGGQGYLARQFGLTVDHIRKVTLVTRDGAIHHLSDSSQGLDARLWWGVRGGAPHLGIVTSVTVETQTLPKMDSFFSMDAVALPLQDTVLMQKFLDQSASPDENPNNQSLNMVVGRRRDSTDAVQTFYASGNGLVKVDSSCTAESNGGLEVPTEGCCAQEARAALDKLLQHYPPVPPPSPCSPTDGRLTKVYKTPDYLVNAADFSFPPLSFTANTSNAKKFFKAGVDKMVFWGNPPPPPPNDCKPLYSTDCNSFEAFEIQSVIIKLNHHENSIKIAQHFFNALQGLTEVFQDNPNDPGFGVISASIALQNTGGKVEEPSDSSMAYFNRKQDWGCSITCAYNQSVVDPSNSKGAQQACARWVAALVKNLDPIGVYIVDAKPWAWAPWDDRESLLVRAFGDNLHDLRELKQHVDPNCMFGGDMLCPPSSPSPSPPPPSPSPSPPPPNPKQP